MAEPILAGKVLLDLFDEARHAIWDNGYAAGYADAERAAEARADAEFEAARARYAAEVAAGVATVPEDPFWASEGITATFDDRRDGGRPRACHTTPSRRSAGRDCAGLRHSERRCAMSRHVAVYDLGEGSRYIGVRGYVSDLFKAQRIPATRDRIKRSPWVRRERLDDLLCLLEHEGYQVKLIEGEPR